MVRKNVFVFTVLMNAVLLSAVSMGLFFGFICFPNVDTVTICFSDFSVSFLAFGIFQLFSYVLFHCFINSASIFLSLLYIFIKSFCLSFLLRFCIDFFFFDRGFLIVLSIDIFILAFAMSIFCRMLYHIQ